MSAVFPTFIVPVRRLDLTVLRRFSTVQIGVAMLLVLSGGVLSSILTTTDPLWWHLHFSRLGTFRDESGALFNGTLIVAGSMVSVFARRVGADIARLGSRYRRRGAARTVHILLTLIGVNLALVGCVPLNTNQFIHDHVAAAMVLSFAGLLFSTPFLLRRAPRKMLFATGGTFAYIFASAWLFVGNTINLALFELLAFAAMFAWSGALVMSVRATARRVETPAAVGAETAPRHRAVRRPRARRTPTSVRPAVSARPARRLPVRTTRRTANPMLAHLRTDRAPAQRRTTPAALH